MSELFVIKRGGAKQRFDNEKIQVAILAAMKEHFGGKNWSEEALQIAKYVEECLFKDTSEEPIERIQDIVESALMKKYPGVAKKYILYRSKHADIRTIEPDAKAVSDYIHASKYAKYLPDKKRREVFEETVARSMGMHMKRFPELKTTILNAFSFVNQRKVLPSMRSMQFGGEAIEAHNSRMYNCCFTLVDRPRVFQEIFYLLLSGCGVGFSVQKQHVSKLPVIGDPDKTKILFHNIKDSIEGWADAIGLMFNSYQKGLYFEPCYQKIRPVGSPLKTGGGKAPGHMPLKKLIEATRGILDGAIGRQLRPLECHDIICHIAEAVLAGGIRRSSLISLFSKDDLEMLSCKSLEHFKYGGLNYQREMANNAVALLRKTTSKEEFMSLMATNRKTMGDPGFAFTDNLDHGMNPCAEIGIDPTLIQYLGEEGDRPDSVTGFGFCNLAEVNVAACKTAFEFYEACEAASFIATLQASYTKFKYLGEVTEEICKRDALIGVGLVGVMDNPKIGLNQTILSNGAAKVVEINIETAQEIGINPAARCTTVKPSGTSSLELGCIGSGIHPHHARRYFRRITANVNEPVAKYFAKYNPHMVEKKPNGDLCITFPIKAPKGAMCLSDLDSMAFMYNIFNVYDSWVLDGTANKDLGLTHNISSTVVVEVHNWDNVFEYAWKNRSRIRAMSFFPKFGDKGVPYAPREEVLETDEAKWKHLISNYSPVDYQLMTEEEDQTTLSSEVACSGGACEIVHNDFAGQADGSVFSTSIFQRDCVKYEVSPHSIDVGGIAVWKHIYTS